MLSRMIFWLERDISLSKTNPKNDEPLLMIRVSTTSPLVISPETISLIAPAVIVSPLTNDATDLATKYNTGGFKLSSTRTTSAIAPELPPVT